MFLQRANNSSCFSLFLCFIRLVLLCFASTTPNSTQLDFNQLDWTGPQELTQSLSLFVIATSYCNKHHSIFNINNYLQLHHPTHSLTHSLITYAITTHTCFHPSQAPIHHQDKIPQYYQQGQGGRYCRTQWSLN